MSMSRAEIELLIKARDEAKGTFDNLNKVVKGVGESSDQTTTKMERLGKSTQTAGAGATAAGVAFGMLADRVGRALVAGFNDSIAAANRLDRGLIGLSSIAAAFGQDVNKATAAAKDLSKDGLMGVGDAAQGLKNLLAAGFGLDQAVVLMNRFKDSAAFGRQGSLEFGEAIRGATEGIKNGNSMMVDNAGVTKNLSNILVEAGFAATDLSKATSDVNIRMALYKGILHETNPMLGDHEKLLKSAAGAQVVFNAQVEIAQQKIGKALQPALAETLGVLTPMAQFVGNNASAFVSLATAVTALVGPVLAWKAATALGITELGKFSASATVTYTNLGMLGSTVAVAATFIAAWQVGKLIGEWTGWTAAIEHWASAAGRAASTAQSNGAVQDTLAKATAAAGRAVTDYTEAIAINNAINDIRLAKYDRSAKAQLAAIAGELQLGRITLEQANAQRLLVTSEEQVANIRSKRVAMADVLTASEKKFRDEVAATGFTTKELIASLRSNEVGFTAWAKTISLSDDTVKRLKDSLTEQNKVIAKNKEEAAKDADAWKELNSAGEGWLGTLEQLDGETVSSIKYYLAAGVSQQALARLYGLTDTEIKAVSTSLERETAETKKAEEATKKLADAMDELNSAGDGYLGTVEAIDGATVDAIQYYLEAGVSQGALAEAYGLTATQISAVNKALDEQKKAADVSKQSATDTANLWSEYYGLVAEKSGNTTRFQIEQIRRWAATEASQLKDNDANWRAHYDAIQMVAHEKIQAIIRENNPLWKAWTNLTADITKNMAGAFTEMLTGAKGFKAGWVSIWDGLKSSFKSILSDLLNYFLNSFIKGMLNGLTGARGGFAGAFSSMFSGGGGGGMFGGGGGGQGGGGGLLGGLLGGGGGGGGGRGGLFGGLLGGGGAAGAGAMGPLGSYTPGLIGEGGGGGAGGAAGAAGAMGNFARFGGGGLMAAGGAMAFWQAHQQGSRLGQVLGGAQTGAGIGTMIAPGIGTLIGGGIGAVGGLIGSFFGTSKKEKEGRAVEKEFEDMLQGLLTKQQLLESGGESWAKTVIAVREAYLKVGKSGKEAEDAVNALWSSSKGGAAEVEKAITPIALVLQQVEEQAAKTGKAIEDDQVSSAEGAATAFDKAAGRITDALQSLGPEAETIKNFIQAELGRLRIRIPVGFDVENLPNPGGGGGNDAPLPEAASGIYATGQRGVATWFGEGGQPEVGGPASFFKGIFESLGIGANGTKLGGDGGASVTLNVYAQTFDVATVERDVLPVIVAAVNGNKRQTRTDLRTALGVT